MADPTLGRVAYLLVLIGGILLVVFGLVSLIGTSIANFSLISGFGLGAGIVQIILGIIALIGAKSASRLEWAIILIIVGLIAGGVGGILVLLGGIVSLILKYA
jgi:hypothetical protein